jgi:hypothetical protein
MEGAHRNHVQVGGKDGIIIVLPTIPATAAGAHVPEPVYPQCTSPWVSHGWVSISVTEELTMILRILYLFFGAFVLVFRTNHDFNLWQAGLSFLGIMGGMIAAILSDPIWRWNYRRLVRRLEAETGKPGGSEPEFRLPPCVVGVWFCVVGLFAFGWTTLPSVSKERLGFNRRLADHDWPQIHWIGRRPTLSPVASSTAEGWKQQQLTPNSSSDCAKQLVRLWRCHMLRRHIHVSRRSSKRRDAREAEAIANMA